MVGEVLSFFFNDGMLQRFGIQYGKLASREKRRVCVTAEKGKEVVRSID